SRAGLAGALLLSDSQFAGAETESLKAHEHYRHGRHAESVNECLKAFESTLKTICTIRKWGYNETDTASRLLDVVSPTHSSPRQCRASSQRCGPCFRVVCRLSGIRRQATVPAPRRVSSRLI